RGRGSDPAALPRVNLAEAGQRSGTPPFLNTIPAGRRSNTLVPPGALCLTCVVGVPAGGPDP
ncbi:MAG: hypothetical protein M3460_22120, partial [Actinomycetota bacterium]|nr:hypothetical protein [Actinomycetota bacterium]